MNKLYLVLFAYLTITPFRSQAASLPDPVSQCVTAINSINSYDALFQISQLFPNADDTSPSAIAFTFTNRDVFAVGLGRRVEDRIGSDSHTIAVKEWRTAVKRGLPLSKAFMRSLPGFTYHDYLNPVISLGGFYLTQFLTDPNSTVKSINALPSEPKLIGFQAANPKVSGFIRLWLDPDHGCMPKQIEWYQESPDGKAPLAERMEISQFIHIQNGDWVPTEATNLRFTPKGSTSSGQKMQLDLNGSSWNSVKSDDLFLASSLPQVNLSEGGWACDYPPGLLRAIKSADLFEKPSRVPGVTILIVLGVVSALGLFLILMMSKKPKHGRPGRI